MAVVLAASVRDLQCGKCGAPLHIPANTKGHLRCQHCDTECLVEGLIKNAEICAKANINSGIPLSAPPELLHQRLVSVFLDAPDIPLDLFDAAEVVREERHCVPAYCFYCSGTASFTYEAGNTRERTVTKDSETVTEQYTEWSQMNSSASASGTFFASGSRAFAPQIQTFYFRLDPAELIDIEALIFPHDVLTHEYNFVEPAAFNEYVKPHITEKIQQNASALLKNKTTRNQTMGEANIQKRDAARVFLGLYRLVYTYGGEEYAVWVSGDGQQISADALPADTKRLDLIAEKKKELNAVQNKTGVFKIGFFVSLILAVATYGLALLAAIPCGIFWFKKHKEYTAKRADIQKEIGLLENQAAEVKSRFQAQNKTLRGIYIE
jgi:hypothetical protein